MHCSERWYCINASFHHGWYKYRDMHPPQIDELILEYFLMECYQYPSCHKQTLVVG